MSYYYPAKEIIPGLWIGSEADATNPKFTRGKFVVNCTGRVPMPANGNAEGTYRVPIDDDPAEHATLLKHLPVVVRLIDENLSHGVPVLVHCRAGMQRSAACVAAYLMYKYRMTWDEARKFIQSKKPETFTSDGETLRPTFNKTLKVYESLLRMKNNSR